MLLFSEKKILEIRNLTNDFVAKTLGNESPEHKCFTICYALSLYLKSNDFGNTIEAGIFEGIPHYWLKIESKQEPIIDPTIRQFHNEKETTSPYFGNKKEIHNKINYNMDDAYEIWRDKLLNCNLKKPELIILLNININAATILSVNIENKNIEDSEIYKKYFDCIYEVIKKYYNKQIFTNLSLLDDFNKLLSKVII